VPKEDEEKEDENIGGSHPTARRIPVQLSARILLSIRVRAQSVLRG
jgi:hypothetical protein